MKRLRFSIENKILLPFVSITLISILAFCLIFFFTEYQLKLNAETAAAQTLTETLNIEIDRSADPDEALQLLRRDPRFSASRNLFLYDRHGIPLFAPRAAGENELILTDSTENRLDWRIRCSLDRKNLIFTILEEQRYMILAAIAMMLVIVQTSTLIAYNISNPIRELSALCTRISREPEAAAPGVGEYADRSDEVGQLAGAFHTMMESLRRHTDELNWVRALNVSIVENLPIGVLAYNQAQKLIFRNARAEAMLTSDTARDEKGRSLRQLLAEALKSGEVLPMQITLTDPAGKVRNCEIGVWKLREPEGGATLGALCTIDDVTYRQHMEEKIARDEKLAYTGQLAADVAHEARNPLAGIRAGLQVIGKKLSDEREQRLCAEMIREVDRINLLIGNLVNLSRRRESEKTTVHLNALCDEILLLYYKAAENKGVRLRAELSGALWLFADEQEIRQILINLINNSIKAMPEGGVVTVAGSQSAAGVSVTVQDTGRGMSEEALASALSGSAGGLGISIVRRLVLRNGGSFRIDSIPGRGTLVTLSFRGTEAPA
ncbi:MAG: sensor histidine kinase [Stomatobaculum sp.]